MTTHTLDGLALPAGMIWQDEFDWSPALSAQEYSLTGALVIDAGTRQAGRPITLAASVVPATHRTVPSAIVRPPPFAIFTVDDGSAE